MKNITKFIDFKSFFVLSIFAFVIIFFIFFSPSFFKFNNLTNIIGFASFVGVPAIGLSIIMLSGSFDLSFVGIIGVVSVITIIMSEAGLPLPLFLLIGLGLAIGFELINAIMIIKLRIHPWLTTIGTMLATLGLEKAISGGYLLTTSHPFFQTIRFEKFLGVPLIAWIFMFTTIFMYILINKTPFGLSLYAIGGNETAAKKMGLKVEKLQFIAFILMGICIEVASILYISQLSGYPMEAAYTNLTEVILAVFFGMSISHKNTINILGSVIGALFVALLANGLGLAGVSSYWIKLIEGIMIIIVVVVNSVGGGELVQLEK